MKEASHDNKSIWKLRHNINLSHLQVDTPFSKSAPNSPMSFVDGSETEVGSINDFASKDWHLLSSASRCSSSDTSKESLFSPATIGRPRSMSSGSGSRKSPRFSETPSSLSQTPCSQLLSPLTVVQEEGRERNGSCSSLSKTLTVWHINDPLSPENVIEEEEIVEDGTLPNFFNPSTSGWAQPRRDRSGSYCPEFDDMPPQSVSSNNDFGHEIRDSNGSGVASSLNNIGNDEKNLQPSSKRSAPEMEIDEKLQFNDNSNMISVKASHLQSHMFSPFASSSSSSSVTSSSSSSCASSTNDPPPVPAGFSDAHTLRAGQGRPSRLESRALPTKGLIRATSLDFDNSFAFSSTSSSSTSSLSTSSSSSSLSTALKFQKQDRVHNRNITNKHRHASVDSNLTRSHTAPCQLRPAPETPPEQQRCVSQADEYLPGNNPRGPNPFNTPQGVVSYNTSGQQGNDWGVTEPSLDFELAMFKDLFRDNTEGPCVAASTSMARGIFSSISSAFGQKSIPFSSKK